MKYKKYILVLVLTVFLGINKTYAASGEDAGICYYMGEGFKATLELRYNYDIVTTHGIRDYAQVFVDDNNGKLIHNSEPINNWWSWWTNWREKCDKSGQYCFEPIFSSPSIANSTKPTCPNYLVFQECNVYKVWATNDASQAKGAASAINSLNDCHGSYASFKNKDGSKITEEQYYGAMVPLDDGGTQSNVTCDSLFGDKNTEGSLSNMINDALLYIRIIVPLAIIVYSAVDFFKCSIAAKEDEIKKAQSSLIKRVIIGVAIFFVPVLVNLVMSLADIVWEGLGYSTCNL